MQKMNDFNIEPCYRLAVSETAVIARSANYPENKPHTGKTLDRPARDFPYPVFSVTSALKTVTVAECALLREGSDHCGLFLFKCPKN